MALDLSGQGLGRWKQASNAFEIRFDGHVTTNCRLEIARVGRGLSVGAAFPSVAGDDDRVREGDEGLDDAGAAFGADLKFTEFGRSTGHRFPTWRGTLLVLVSQSQPRVVSSSWVLPES